MRKLLTIVSLLWAITGYSQEQKYHRVKVNTGKDGLARLAAAGIAVDHGSFKKDVYFISDLSDEEVTAVRDAGLTYIVLIEDVSAYYQQRNRRQEAAKPTGLTGCEDCVTYPTPANFQLGSMGGFFTYQQMLDILDSMKSKYPDLITLKQPISATTTVGGRPVYYVKISDNAATSEPEPKALYTALHHAREAQSLSQLIYYMWYLLEHYNTDAEIKYLVDNTELFFVPCVNPDGYVYNQTTNPNGGGMWRKNRRNNGNGTFGVDLNRNYGMFWGYDNVGSSPNGSSETYRGTAGFSEAETQMLRDFCNSHPFGIALNAHTYSNLLIYPYGHVPSVQTPDSSVFQAFAKDMTECSHFLSGTGDQTVGYVSNGDSDDWMYGEQTTKAKIYALTPEAGDESDGFWPQSSRIIPIARQTMDQNLDVARLSAEYARVKATDPITVMGSDLASFSFQRTGLTNSDFTVSIVPLTGNIVNTGAPVVFHSPVHLQLYNGSIPLTVAAGTTRGAAVRYALEWVNARGFKKSDTIVRYYGLPDTLFYSNCDNMDDFVASSNSWGVTTASPASGTGCLTDSPNGNYPANANSKLTTKKEIDLAATSMAMLTFYARWDVERGFDFVTVSASENGTTYTPLCGLYNHNGNDNQGSVPVYDGLQQAWVKEYISLQDYAGKKITLQFRLASDGGLEKDGFYLDDVAVLAYGGTPTGIKDAAAGNLYLDNVPNPCAAQTQVRFDLGNAQGDHYLLLTDQLGRMLSRQLLQGVKGAVTLDVRNYANGMYYYRIVSSTGSSAVKKMVVLH
ncbi:M14 family zinc carboxypeptidase [Taibaiella chishuiensis]|uniref:carboxypeptidase T n=1 Tax=Taibaiella chishuiensis TaxID=1434707 RepID=A0A2P8D9G9_9BACT|nr:M14 family zinc carboxypeptidase [Taibaiella chishuiensis]PSK93866.1 putative secreted protein (Por secretion system target) [Taibaiella chishuiensis]